MDENLLTILTSRWGERKLSSGADLKPDRAEHGSSARSLAIALVASPAAAWREALAQASLLQGRLTAEGLAASLLTRGESTKAGALSYVRSFRLYLKRLPALMKDQTIAHIIIDHPREIWLTALPAIIVARFYGLSAVLHLLGDWPSKLNPIISRLVKPILDLTEQVWVSTGVGPEAKICLRTDLHEVGPLIDLDSISERNGSPTIQPSLLVDARELKQLAVQELIAGCQLAKEKYPRTEVRILLNNRVAASLESSVEKTTRPGITFVSSLLPEQFRAMLAQADIFLTGSKALLIDSLLLEAAAHGLPVLVGKHSPLRAMLKENHKFEPVGFRNRSDLADAIIKLVEEPDLVEKHSWRSKALAEQFAWDNAITTIKSHYLTVSKIVTG